METQKPDPEGAAAALAAMQAATQRARPFELPLWYHAAVGALLGTVVAIQAVPLPQRLALFVPVLVGLPVLVRYYRRKTGRVVYGLRRGRTFSAGLATMLVALTMLFLGAGEPPLVTPWLGGLVTFVVTSLTDWWWVRAYRAELEGRP